MIIFIMQYIHVFFIDPAGLATRVVHFKLVPLMHQTKYNKLRSSEHLARKSNISDTNKSRIGTVLCLESILHTAESQMILVLLCH